MTGREGREQRQAGWGGNVALLLASLVFTALLLEVGTRLLSGIGPSLLVTDTIRGKHWLEGYDASVFVPESHRQVHLRFHRDGFRGEDLPYEKPPGVRRVAILGDSMIAAVAVAEPRTLVGLLQAGLDGDRRDGPTPVPGRIEVMNFGVSSASTGQELVTYRQVARRYQPDVVVLAFNDGNDLADNCSCLSRAPRLYFDLDATGRLVEHPYATPALPRWLDLHSRFYVWQRAAFARLRARLREAEGRLDPGTEIFQVEAPAVEKAWSISAALVAALATQTRKDGARLVLLQVPAPEEVYDDLWERLARRAGTGVVLERTNPSRRLAGIARDAGVPYLDLGPSLRAAAPHRNSLLEPEQVFFYGKYHLNEAGNRLAADALRRFLEAQGAP